MRHPALLAWLRLAQVFQKIDTASARHFRQHELTTAQFDVLARVGVAEGLSQQELAGSLLVTKGNISQILKRMEQQGLIKRCQEGRTNCLFLTEEGRYLHKQAVPAQEALIIELMQALSLEEQHQLLHLLRKVDRSLA
ncbi:MAG: MarR family transcriptional regulator [Blastochloris sp.]|nr:MarR family transcriptional regulator [Blastochloris sp.]